MNPSIVLPGNYDGVHLGHQALIHAARRHADAHGLAVQVLSFDPHPMALLCPEQAPLRLTDMTRRAALVRQAGADGLMVLPFTTELAALSPEDFVRHHLVEACGARAIVVGEGFRFGAGRLGDVALLRGLGLDLGFEVLCVPPIKVDQLRVSSSRVRESLAAGEISLVTRLLGRPYDVTGTVVQGAQRGRTLGFPTANLSGIEVMLPLHGVFVVQVAVLGQPSWTGFGVANLGPRPTFGASSTVEVHVLDFAGDLYGKQIQIGFVERLRGQIRFDGPEALARQISQDIAAARKFVP